MVVLHVAAMPFPSPQGTQAAVRAMLEALAAAGQETHLATYARGAGTLEDAAFTVHRVPDLPRDRSLRSGPSVRKLVLDASLAALVPRLVRRLRPSLVVAHHAEAMLAALAARARPLVYVAHTALGPELPAYWGSLNPSLLSLVGDALDRRLVRRADEVCAIAPSLAEHLTRNAERPVHSIPFPWPPTLIRGDEHRGLPVPQATVRREFGFSENEQVLLYAGNLDRYQGVETLLDAAQLVAGARLLVATESSTDWLEREARRRGLTVTVAPLATESDRSRAHAAADVSVVPRALPGGVPVKLLDALSRGVPVVASRRATGGLALDEVAVVVADDDAEALAVGIRMLLAAPRARASLAAAGRAYVAREHSADRFVAAFRRVIEDL